MNEEHQPVQATPLGVPSAITVILKQDEHESPKKNPDFESIARILSLIAIPVVVAIFGALIQGTINRSTVSRDYVQLAVSVLTSEKGKAPAELRAWAVELLNQNSPTKFSKDVAERLEAGQISLPSSIVGLLANANSGGMAVSPDGRIFATGQNDGTIRIWNLNSGQELAVLHGHTDAVTSIAFSSDGQMLLSGSADRTARLWQLSTGRAIMVLIGHTAPVVGVGFADSRTAITRSLDGTITFWDTATGATRRRLTLPR